MTKEQFLSLLQEQQSSGLTVVEYCQIQSISPSTFTYWKRKYGFTGSRTTKEGRTKTPKTTNLVPVQVQKSPSGISHCSKNNGASNGVLIQMPNGVQVEFASSTDHVAIQMLNSICSRYV